MNKLLVQLTVEELKQIIAEEFRNQSSNWIKQNPQETNIIVYRRKELASLLGVTVQTINSWVRSGQLPKPTKVGRIPVFSQQQINHLLNVD